MCVTATALDRALDRVLSWQRSHVIVVDGLWASFLLALGLLAWPVLPLTESETVVYVLVVLGCAVALSVRRRAPVRALSAIAALLMLQVVFLDQFSVFAGVVCLVAAYTSQAQLRTPHRWVFFVMLLAGVAWAVFDVNSDALAGGLAFRAIASASAWSLVAVFALLGSIRRRNQDRVVHAVERAQLVQAQQASERELAALDERTRIARDMHDVLAHSLNVMVAQAEGARYVLDSDPAQAQASLATIGDVGRQAVTEVQHLLDVLRSPEPRGTRPTPGEKDIHDLLGQFRAAGLDITVTAGHSPPGLAPSVGLTLYRLVQEALTNVLKHAGKVAVTVRITWTDNEVSLLVRNDAGSASAPPSLSHSGHGVVGMGERVRMLDGSFDAGPMDNTGGWQVHAVLPWHT